MYSLAGQKVYVLRRKRIRFDRETYTSWARNVYVLGQVALPLRRRGIQEAGLPKAEMLGQPQ